MGNPETKCGYGFHTGSLVEINLQVNLFYWHGMMSLLDYNKWNELGCNTPLNPPNSEACYSLAIEIQETVGILRQPPAPKVCSFFSFLLFLFMLIGFSSWKKTLTSMSTPIVFTMITVLVRVLRCCSFSGV